jgi:diaminopimelate decarboxylase
VNDAAFAQYERATLVFDLQMIDRNMRRVADAARVHGIVPLFAMKSFPHARVRELAATHLDGFDVASVGELREAPRAKIISIADPSGDAIAMAPTNARVIVGCETVEHVRRAPAHAEIAIRISASITERDPAIGAVLEGSGRRRSRFGLDDRAQIAELVKAAAGRRVGVHVHHGPVTATSAERFVATARAALAMLDVEPAFIDLGGAWHGIDDIERAFGEVRAALGAVEILVEPGRLFAQQAGFATGRILSSRDIGDRTLAVCELSRICHLRWSQVELVAKAPHPGEGRKLQLVGPTCYEEDMIGEWIVGHVPMTRGRVVLRNVSGYALAWNTSFGGVPAADVVFT